MDLEHRIKRIKSFRKLPKLREAIRNELQLKKVICSELNSKKLILFKKRSSYNDSLNF